MQNLFAIEEIKNKIILKLTFLFLSLCLLITLQGTFWNHIVVL